MLAVLLVQEHPWKHASGATAFLAPAGHTSHPVEVRGLVRARSAGQAARVAVVRRLVLAVLAQPISEVQAGLAHQELMTRLAVAVAQEQRAATPLLESAVQVAQVLLVP